MILQASAVGSIALQLLIEEKRLLYTAFLKKV